MDHKWRTRQDTADKDIFKPALRCYHQQIRNTKYTVLAHRIDAKTNKSNEVFAIIKDFTVCPAASGNSNPHKIFATSSWNSPVTKSPTYTATSTLNRTPSPLKLNFPSRLLKNPDLVACRHHCKNAPTTPSPKDSYQSAYY